jgi:hypothetical protein
MRAFTNCYGSCTIRDGACTEGSSCVCTVRPSITTKGNISVICRVRFITNRN